jgi:hypothetical protein
MRFVVFADLKNVDRKFHVWLFQGNIKRSTMSTVCWLVRVVATTVMMSRLRE